MNEENVEKPERQTETIGILKTQDQSVDNPKKSLDSLRVHKSMEFDYLEQQKENLSKVDELIEKAEKSLIALKTEFYHNNDGPTSPSSPQLAACYCIDEILEPLNEPLINEPLIQFSYSSITDLKSNTECLCEEKAISAHLDLPEIIEPKVLLDCGTSMSNEKIELKDQMVQCTVQVMVNTEVNTEPQKPDTFDLITFDRSTSKTEDARISFLSDQSKSLDCSECDVLPKDDDNYFGLMKSIENQTDLGNESDCTCPLNSEVKELEEDKSLDDITEDFNDGHLNTISERTEIEESERIIVENCTNKKESKLKIQLMPKIDIRPALTMQSLCKINIKPSGSFELNSPKNINVGYHEVKHNTVKEKNDVPNLSQSQTVTMHLNQIITDKNKNLINLPSTSRSLSTTGKNTNSPLSSRSRSQSPRKCKHSNPPSPSNSKSLSCAEKCKNTTNPPSPSNSKSLSCAEKCKNPTNPPSPSRSKSSSCAEKCKNLTIPPTPVSSRASSPYRKRKHPTNTSSPRSRSSSPSKHVQENFSENKITYINEYFTHTPEDSDNEFIFSDSMRPSRKSCICSLGVQQNDDIIKNSSEHSSASKSKSMPIKQESPIEIIKVSNSETKSTNRNSDFIPPIEREILRTPPDLNVQDDNLSGDESLKTALKKPISINDEPQELNKKRLSFQDDIEIFQPFIFPDKKFPSAEQELQKLNPDMDDCLNVILQPIDTKDCTTKTGYQNLFVSATTQTDNVMSKNVATLPEEDISTNSLSLKEPYGLFANKSDVSSESEYVLGRDVATQVSQQDEPKSHRAQLKEIEPLQLPQLKTTKTKTVNNEMDEYFIQSELPCCKSKPLPVLHKTKPYPNQIGSRTVPSGDSLTLPHHHHYSGWFEKGYKTTTPPVSSIKGTKIVASGGSLVPDHHYSSWFDEKNYKTTSERSMSPNSCNRRLKKSSKLTDSSCTVSEDRSLPEESISDGEIRCKCSVSIGELHLCRYANDIKSKCIYKKYPEKIVKPQNIVKETVFYDNWIAYYTSPGSSGEEPGCYSRKKDV